MNFNINEFNNHIKHNVELTEKLNVLEIIGNKELADFYEVNKEIISFDLLKDNILAGYTLDQIKEVFEKVIYNSITINHVLSLNLEIHKLKNQKGFKH